MCVCVCIGNLNETIKVVLVEQVPRQLSNICLILYCEMKWRGSGLRTELRWVATDLSVNYVLNTDNNNVPFKILGQCGELALEITKKGV